MGSIVINSVVTGVTLVFTILVCLSRTGFVVHPATSRMQIIMNARPRGIRLNVLNNFRFLPSNEIKINWVKLGCNHLRIF
jgi:hypothetical protein